jgi:recombinational DNA repair ATPase RecF
MKKTIAILAASVALGCASPIVVAADASMDVTTNAQSKAQAKETAAEPFHQAREKLSKMTPEERKTFLKESRAKWEKLSPEEKIKFKVEMREKMHMLKKQQAERKMVKIYSLYLLEQQQ